LWLLVLFKSPLSFSGLTSKAERAAVGEAAKLWSQLVSTKQVDPIKVHLNRDVAKNSALCVFPVFEAPKIKAGLLIFAF
jgi:hypothetical protein